MDDGTAAEKHGEVWSITLSWSGSWRITVHGDPVGRTTWIGGLPPARPCTLRSSPVCAARAATAVPPAPGTPTFTTGCCARSRGAPPTWKRSPAPSVAATPRRPATPPAACSTPRSRPCGPPP
ncbi:glycoside hydrolase family 36 N-terminal domain-containing protein [Streptomyces sp. NPDC059080]|uniref:glycoside hydrolase family 36 N-terminal domain-containing protein n=1 Tax=Streptomyces sp. NPDC059080 TaxID=3346718 RepID=UPI0036A132CC